MDKYERAAGVRNVDVLDLPPEPAYDLIVSVSTLEHVGRDETAARARARACARSSTCARLLRPGGTLFATVPVGYNPALDAALAGGAHGCAPCGADRGVRSIPPRRWSVRTTSSSTAPTAVLFVTADSLR